MLAVTVGISVLAWTASQTFSYGVATGRPTMKLNLLTKGKRDLVRPGPRIRGYLAALITPLRDVVGPGR